MRKVLVVHEYYHFIALSVVPNIDVNGTVNLMHGFSRGFLITYFFPGAGKLHAVDVGNAMVTAVEQHIKSTKTSSIMDVHIVIFQTDMFQDFLKSLMKCKKVTQAVKKVTVGVKVSAVSFCTIIDTVSIIY